MKNTAFSKTFVFVVGILLFALLLSQRGLSAMAADANFVANTRTPTVTITPTIVLSASPSPSPTPGCELIVGANFRVAGGDDLQFDVTNLNTQTVALTNTTLYWTDYYDPDMWVDYFLFGGIEYWFGDDLDSPTTINSSVPFSGTTSTTWSLDFDGYGNIYGQTHTIGPFTVELTFNNDDTCKATATIPAVYGQVKKPTEGQIISNINQANFEAIGWDTGVGTTNGSGIDIMHIVILDEIGNVIVNRIDTTAPYCAWGTESPCPQPPRSDWEALAEGHYQMIVWARSAITSSWSPPHTVRFFIDRTPPITPDPTRATPVATSTPRPTLTPSP